MAFFSLLAEAESFTHDIYKFQSDIGNKKASQIDSTLQKLIERIAIIGFLNLSLLNVSKRKIRTVASASSHFYDFSWLIDTDKFPVAVACFEKIIANSQIMESSLQQSITSVVTSVIAITVAVV